MKKNIFAFFLAFLSLLGACNSSKQEITEGMNIVCTTGMIGDAVKNVVGDIKDVRVSSLMEVGVDPHLYKATPGDLDQLRMAQVIFYNGLHLEGKMAEILQKLKHQKTVIAVSQDIPTSQLRQVEKGVYDPHIWFDVSLWQQVVMTITETLKKQDSTHATTYQKNAEAYLQKLKSLDTELAQKIREIPDNQRVIVTSHDAFGYFGKAYEIEVKGLQGISTLSEAGLRDITDLVDFIVEKKLKAVFVETSVSEKDIKAVVEGCRQKGHDLQIGGTLYGDAMGAADTPAGNYIGMLRSNTKTIVNALSK